jgi:hypothetical protein
MDSHAKRPRNEDKNKAQDDDSKRAKHREDEDEDGGDEAKTATEPVVAMASVSDGDGDGDGGGGNGDNVDPSSTTKSQTMASRAIGQDEMTTLPTNPDDVNTTTTSKSSSSSASLSSSSSATRPSQPQQQRQLNKSKLFQNMLGTIQTFKKQISNEKTAQVLQRRAEVEKKVDSKVQVDAERNAEMCLQQLQQVDQDKEQATLKRKEISSQLRKTEMQLNQLKWDRHYAATKNFLLTKTHPPIFYMFNKRDEFVDSLFTNEQKELRQKLTSNPLSSSITPHSTVVAVGEEDEDNEEDDDEEERLGDDGGVIADGNDDNTNTNSAATAMTTSTAATSAVSKSTRSSARLGSTSRSRSRSRSRSASPLREES